MYAERMTELLHQYRRLAATPIDKSSKTLPDDIKARDAALQMVDLITAVLFPKDEADG